jgi:hypothetical protein
MKKYLIFPKKGEIYMSQFLFIIRSKINILILICTLAQFCSSEPVVSESTNRSSTPNPQTVSPVAEEIIEKKPPLFLLNKKETVQVSACSCKAILQNNEDRNIAGKLVNIFTKEADREYKLTCKGIANNKTKFKLSNMQVVFHLLSETEYPLFDTKPVEYLNNYILPNKKGNFEIDVLYDTGLSIFMKKVAKVSCEIKSIKETQSGEILTE